MHVSFLYAAALNKQEITDHHILQSPSITTIARNWNRGIRQNMWQ